jgi:uncharacterized RDD family membrane protein YckC
MSSDNWYYARDGQQFGPVTSAALQEMAGKSQLAREDLVWSEGMDRWVAAGTRADLFGPVGAEPTSAAPVAVGYATPASLNYYHGGSASVRYAGFWLRFVAAIIDGAILWVPAFLMQLGAHALGAIRPAGPFAFNNTKVLAPMAGAWAADMVMRWLYYAFFEASEFQATPGKMALGLIVTDEEGVRIGFGRATGRYFGKILSGLILYIGFMMAGWTQKKQALHDILAKTLVVRKGIA